MMLERADLLKILLSLAITAARLKITAYLRTEQINQVHIGNRFK